MKNKLNGLDQSNLNFEILTRCMGAFIQRVVFYSIYIY
jgi:hypothetical protein